MSNISKRTIASSAILLTSLLVEVVACAGIYAALDRFMAPSTPPMSLLAVTGAAAYLWMVSAGHRVVFLHLYASWRLKRFLLVRHIAAPIVALADLALALVYAALISVFYDAGIVLFKYADWGIPIFSAIFFGSLVSSILMTRYSGG